MKDLKEESLKYHIGGKTEISVKKPCVSVDDLSKAYSPGVAYPCLEISKDESLVYKYTNKSNLIAVISDGSAVLGLGDIGACAAKPVMEGKSVLFKKFAGVDAFDIELGVSDPDEIVKVCKALEPTLGGINLEDIRAPKCFYIEKKLQEEVEIPIMHDDQHGTAIITTAGLLNAIEISGKDISKIKVVVNGAGAAGIACAKMYRHSGVKNIIMLDSKGVIKKSRTDLTPEKEEFAIDSDISTLEEAMVGADMFLGLSKAGVVSKDMVKSMAPHPIIFALANPDPEIKPEDAKEVRDDLIIGTGRSDYENQVNNVLGFPYIFRGALDVRAKKITENMKFAAARALADLAKEEIPADLKEVLGKPDLKFGKDYIIPSPFDKRLLAYVSSAVAKAAIDDGVARISLDIKEYFQNLQN